MVEGSRFFFYHYHWSRYLLMNLVFQNMKRRGNVMGTPRVHEFLSLTWWNSFFMFFFILFLQFEWIFRLTVYSLFSLTGEGSVMMWSLSMDFEESAHQCEEKNMALRITNRFTLEWIKTIKEKLIPAVLDSHSLSF